MKKQTFFSFCMTKVDYKAINLNRGVIHTNWSISDWHGYYRGIGGWKKIYFSLRFSSTKRKLQSMTFVKLHVYVQTDKHKMILIWILFSALPVSAVTTLKFEI